MNLGDVVGAWLAGALAASPLVALGVAGLFLICARARPATGALPDFGSSPTAMASTDRKPTA